VKAMLAGACAALSAGGKWRVAQHGRFDIIGTGSL